MNRAAVISLTENGRRRSAAIAEALPDMQIQRFCFYKHTDADAESFSDLAALTAALFPQYPALIFVCACGIAVRMIAPHLRSKAKDPAVLVLDDCGRFVIPIVSGHLGGANALAAKLASIIGAQAVITTATDTGQKFSPDSFAAANHLLISDLSAAKEIAAAVLDGETVGFRCAYPFRNLPAALSAEAVTRCGIVIGTDTELHPFPVTLHLIPRSLVLGIGCKRNTDAARIEQTVREILGNAGLSFDRICAVTSIGLKAGEPGLLQFCDAHQLPFVTYSAAELMQTEGEFTASAFVMETTGADNICERSAVRYSGGRLILRKTAADGITVAAAEIPPEIDFERNML